MGVREDAVARTKNEGAHRPSLIQLIQEFGAQNVVEVGVYRGITAEMVLKECGTQLKGYWMVDQWKPFGNAFGKQGAVGEQDAGCPEGEMWETLYQRVRSLTGVYPQAHVLRMDSVQAAQTFQPGAIDLVFIDADHSYEGCKRDIEAWFPIVRNGGIVAGHDYYHRWPGVVRAVDEVLVGRRMFYLPDTVWYVRKRSVE